MERANAKTTVQSVMVSGHIDLSWVQFLAKYAELIERAIHGRLPPTFVPMLPNSPELNEAYATDLPPFDLVGAAPFLIPVLTMIQQRKEQEIQQISAPDPKIPDSISNVINNMFKPVSAQVAATSPQFVVGDARGSDFFTQVYLLGRGLGSNITVYHRGRRPQCLASNNITTVGHFDGHEDKDGAMTAATNVDIAWIRTEDEQRQIYGETYRPRKSGTEKNICRRLMERERTTASAAVVVAAASSKREAGVIRGMAPQGLKSKSQIKWEKLKKKKKQQELAVSVSVPSRADAVRNDGNDAFLLAEMERMGL